jgi:hypothetical protein
MDGRVTGRRAYGFVAVDVEGDDLLVAGHYRDLHLAAAVREREEVEGRCGRGGLRGLGVNQFCIYSLTAFARNPLSEFLATRYRTPKDYFPRKLANNLTTRAKTRLRVGVGVGIG